MANSPDDKQSRVAGTAEATPVWRALEDIEDNLTQLKAAISAFDLPRPVNRLAQVRTLIEARRVRSDLFSPMLFSDPAWDVLLELYARDLEEQPVNISRLTAAVPVAATTTLRWLDRLEEEALITRRGDDRHAKRIFIALSQYGRSLMDRYFNTASERGLI